MAHFLVPLKKDLALAKFAFLEAGKEKMTVVMGRVIDAVDMAALMIPVEEELTPIQELQRFRRRLNEHLDWEWEFKTITKDEMDQLRKIVNDLTETDHLHLISFS